MPRFNSPYYPPRAHWYAPLITAGGRLRQRLARQRLVPAMEIPGLGLLGSIVVPGLGFYIRGPRRYGQLALAACFVLLLMFVAELGRPLANLAFGLLLAVHGTGINYLLAPSMAGVRFHYRVLLSMAVLVVLGTLLYLPVQNFVAARWVMPLRIQQRVVIVRAIGNPSSLRRGDWVAYTIREQGDHNGWIQGGYGFGPVLALGGDYIRFTSAAFEVNGKPQPRQANMPGAGELTVPQNCWFVWPEVGIGGHGVGAMTLGQTLLGIANVTQDQLVGRPFKHWFWHHQFPP